MSDPVAYFLTWVTYGSWLPGDQRGWVEYHKGWKLPNPLLEIECKIRQSEESCLLTQRDRCLVETQIARTCETRKWRLFAVNCRSNHVHVVLAASNTLPTKIRIDLKAYATRRLKIESTQAGRKNWWGERGSVRWVWNKESLDQVVRYTKMGQ
ncbi:MAG: transposase [Planctomycetota bacterium]